MNRAPTISSQTPAVVISYGPPESPRTWSGTPKAICTAFRDNHVQIRPIDASPPNKFRKSIYWFISILKYTNPYFRDSPEFSDWCAKNIASQLTPAEHQSPLLHLGTKSLGAALQPYYNRSIVFMDLPLSLQARMRKPRRDDKRNIESEGQHLREVRCILATGQYVKDEVVHQYDVNPDKVKIVGSGYSKYLAQITSNRPKDYSRQRILFVSKIASGWSYKGGRDLLAAFKQVRKQLPKASLIVVGCEEIAHLLKHEDGVESHGFVDEELLAHLYSTASVFCMPAVSEPWGLVYLEALSTGTPVIACNHLGAYEIVTNSGGGWLVSRGNHKELVETLTSTLLDPLSLELRGKAGKIYVENNYSWGNIVESFYEALDQPFL